MVLEERIASILRVFSLPTAYFWIPFWLLSDPEDEGDTFIQNVSGLLPNHTA
jgi:hypothetical protein